MKVVNILHADLSAHHIVQFRHSEIHFGSVKQHRFSMWDIMMDKLVVSTT